MKTKWMLLAVLAVVSTGCGADPADVAGQYQGSQSVSIPGASENLSGASTFVTVTQNGGEIILPISGCTIKAYANSSSTFAVDPFKCTMLVQTKTWELNVTEGTVTGNASSLNLNSKGRAKSGSLDEAMTFTFSGSKR